MIDLPSSQTCGEKRFQSKLRESDSIVSRDDTKAENREFHLVIWTNHSCNFLVQLCSILYITKKEMEHFSLFFIPSTFFIRVSSF